MSDSVVVSETLDAITDPDALNNIVEYLRIEIDKATEERSEYLNKVEVWRRQREAKPEELTKTYPFPKASNVVVPQALINTQSLYGAAKAMFGQKKPFWNVSTEKKEFFNHAKAITRYLDILAESKFHLNIRDKNNTIFYELISLGTQFVKVPWLKEVWKYKKEKGAESEIVTRTLHDGPAIVPIRIDDFFTRAHITNLQTAKWVGIRHNFEYHEMIQRQQWGFFANVEEVEPADKDMTDEHKYEEEERGGISRVKPENIFEVYEIFVFWDLDEDGVSEDIHIWFDWQSKTVLRAEYNNLGFRDIVRIPYIQRPFELYAMGVGWVLEHLQNEVDTLHNQRIDAVHKALMQGAAVRRGAGMGDLTLEPGFIWEVDNPREDVNFIKVPEVGASSVQSEYMVREYADRATGANNAMTGHPDQHAKTRATASGTMFLAQQSSMLFDAITENIEMGYDEIGLFVILQLMEHRDDVKLDMLNEEDAELVREVLDMKFQDIHLNFSFKLNTTEIDQTKEAMKQSLLTLIQLYDMYVQKLLQASMMLYNPQIPPQVRPILIQAIASMNKLMEEVLGKFNQPKDDLIIVMRDIEMMSNAMKQMGGTMNGLGQTGTQVETGQDTVGGNNIPMGGGLT